MNSFYVFNGKVLKQLALVVTTAFVAAWFLYIGNLVHLPAFSAKDGPKAIYKGEKDLALTFNIGWGDEKAEPILDILKAGNVKSATFFLAGSWAERHPDLVARIVKEGYEIGMLGYNYEDYTELEEQKIRQDIAKAQVAFKTLNVKNIKLLRAPTGHFDKKTLKVAEGLGYTVVHWSVDSKDWTNPGVESIIKNASHATKGDILLFHASDSAKQTAKALPQILKDIHSKNLKLVSVSELMADAETKTNEIK
ncbi:polysaccharide deacetylase family sporulation protein PdaB [Cytobacillus sp. FJAT-53684]|uniref:Polysaccharide deacetylase family sporulation protein PdaB n=1 Tax=Cytobacillus mangrovibacter TaxID=3299024 RepID=A0ABW6K3E0_9BACI